MFEATTQVRVRYGETDKMNVVYYANYLRYFERGRSDYLRLAGVDHTALLERQGFRGAERAASGRRHQQDDLCPHRPVAERHPGILQRPRQ